MKGRCYQDFRDRLSREEQDRAHDIAEDIIEKWLAAKPMSDERSRIEMNISGETVPYARRHYGKEFSMLVEDIINKGIKR